MNRQDNRPDERGRRGCETTSIGSAAALCILLLASSAFAQATAPLNSELFSNSAKEATRSSLDQQDLEFLIDVGSRVVLPLGNPVDQVSGTSLLYVQFQSSLDGVTRRALGAAGVNLIKRVGKKAYVAQVTADGAAALAAIANFRGSEPVQPEDKLTEKLFTKQGISYAIDAAGKTETQIKFVPSASLDAAMTVLRAAGVVMDAPDDFLFGNYIDAALTDEQILVLAASPAVLAVREALGPVKDYNANSAAYSNSDVLQTDTMYLLDGTGVTIGMWESGNPRTTHQEFGGRVQAEQGSVTDHGSHVGGTILAAGVDPNARGMAPAAGTLHSYTNSNAPTEMVTAVGTYGIVISNNSWGAILGWDKGADTGNASDFGNYTSLSEDWDNVVLATGLVISKAAGNDRGDCDPADATDCDGTMAGDGIFYGNMGPRSMAKNLIAVGAVDSALGGTNDIAGFSSAGPADDGRIKPDIVADGASLYSSCFANDSDYCNKGGTSMSTPSVTGSTALLIQHYRDHYGPGNEPSPEIMKGLLVNSAAERGRTGPDYLYGHGMLDALAAAQIIDEGEIRIISNAVDQDDVDEYLMLVPDGMDELRVTMNWLDPAGEESNSDAVFQDLDLELEDPDGAIHYPWMGPGTGNVTGNATRSGPNTVDNVEDAEVTSPIPGVWIARVTGTDVEDGPQNYALVANQDFALPDQPEIEVNFSGDIVGACTFDQVDRLIRIFNTGGGDLFVNSVSLADVSGGNFLILDNPAQPVIIAGGSHVDYTLRYQPSDPIDDSATLVIISNDVDEGTLELLITGQVGIGNIAASFEADGDFGDVMSGATKSLNLELINEGSCDGVVDDVFRQAGSTEFSVATLPGSLDFPITLAAGSNFAVPVDFTADAPPFGDRNATMAIDWRGYPGGSVTTETLPVSGVSSPPDITISGDGDFGVVCGGEMAERDIQVCNTGALNTLTVTSASIDCPDFTIIGNPFPADVSHDFCLPLTVRYTPTSAGSFACTLSIASNDPDEPIVEVPLTGETPLNALADLEDLTFDPTVIQEIGPGEDRLALPVVNGGMCPVTVTDISDDSEHYDVAGEPVLPVILQTGEQLGDGALEMLFQPLTLARELTGTVTVTYEEDPITGDTNSVSANLCGEGVHTGARVLVTRDGTPVDLVESIQLLRQTGNTNGKGKGGKTDSVDVAHDVPLSSVVGVGPACPSFDYHMEYGTVANPIQLLPGDYLLTVMVPNASGKGKKSKMTQAFSVEVTDFVHTIVVDF